ncbi:MAG TPA: hypothetical protein VFJ82_07280 [Longimicrobium sp.]|nr:hypothetical protein [Longimicrobium sp.]
MPRATLDIDALAVETFPTTAQPTPALEQAKASGATSCVNRPPYCTC